MPFSESPGARQSPRHREDWRAPGAVLLVSCYELGHQPVSLASPLGFLRRADFAPEALDAAVETFPREKAERALFVGISVPMHTALRIGVSILQKVRAENPGCHICFYGLYATLNAGYLLKNGADSVIGGEFETPLVSLVEALSESRPARGAPGVGTPGSEAAPYLEKLPFASPAREGLPPLSAYARLARNGGHALAGAVEASRGCRHLCRHCPIPPLYGGRFFIVPPETVLEDIRALVREGAEHITFADPDFLNGPGHAMRIARALHAEFPQITFDFTAKVEHIIKYENRIGELGKLGCLFIVTAVESLSGAVLEKLQKGHTGEDVRRAVRIARAAGVSIRPSLVSFTPWTTAGDYLEVLDFVEEMMLIDEVDPVHFAIRLLVPPGSSLLEEGIPNLGPLDEENFIYRWEHPDPRMDRLHEAVLALVEEAAANEEDPARTFGHIRALAGGILGRPERAGRGAPHLDPDRIRPPRLTESWFC